MMGMPSPIVQLPQTPLYQQQQQQQPLLQYLPDGSLSPLADAAMAAIGASGRRPQVARGLQYSGPPLQLGDAAAAAQSARPGATAVSGLGVDSFRMLSVLGRGHFGKVILSQYKNTGAFGIVCWGGVP